MPSSASSPSARVIIRLPYNRPQEGFENPPRIEWNVEKETILWEVIARSRASDSGGTDWQGLAAHLAVPLPYLLFRAQTRYEEDLRGLQDLRGALGPSTVQPSTKSPEEDGGKALDRPELIRRISGRTVGSLKLSSSTGLNTPLGVRARLNSLGYDSGHRKMKASASSTLTLQGVRSIPPTIKTTSSPSQSDSESDRDAEKAEEEERRLEEQEALDKKLKHLQTVLTSEALGLVRDMRSNAKGKEPQRGRDLRSTTSPSPLRQTVQRGDLSPSGFNSTSSSPQGSIPSIPSPSSDSLSQAPTTRHLSHSKKSSSPPALSSGQARGQPHMQYRPMTVGVAQASDRSSNQGSSASSFSDISESTSLSASALESALLSNIRGTGSRFSAFARSQVSRRTSGGVHQ